MYANQECSSGCESGWTLYLDHSSISPYNQENDEFRKNEVAKRLDEEDDEDLSMVSDASSGPPHLHEEEEGYGGGSNTNHYPIIDDPLCKNSSRVKKRRRNAQDQQSSLLDDTASSPFLDSSYVQKSNLTLARGQPLVGKNELEYSQGYSSTQFEVWKNELQLFSKFYYI
ncbi:hypothetical protein PHJA_001008200 [Phtheirospermum japonicum]|uniref:Uncharacterized protein n=1 Tax=Phtheirospermum japonicum TaxID=374723 RepID=A0A830BZK6_9LAMI|nr:hypothetical protein PHJA_001008200 [Phtheirospermum japonicum]